MTDSNSRNIYDSARIEPLMADIKRCPSGLICCFNFDERHDETYRFKSVELEIGKHPDGYFYVYSVHFPDDVKRTQPCHGDEPLRRYEFLPESALGRIFENAKRESLVAAEASGEAEKKRERDNNARELLHEIIAHPEELEFVSGSMRCDYMFRGDRIRTIERPERCRLDLVGYWPNDQEEIVLFMESLLTEQEHEAIKEIFWRCSGELQPGQTLEDLER